MAEKRAVFLSIDFDFFPVMPGAFPERKTRLPDGEEVSNYWLYDWGHSESWGTSPLGNFMWVHRAGEFGSKGLDLKREIAIDPERGSVLPGDFLAFLDSVGEKLPVVAWAESHVQAFPILRDIAGWLERPVEVWHFDAHHDLGYRADAVDGMRTSGRISCEDWLLAACDLGLTENVSVVYPDWRGLGEWRGIDDFHDWVPKAAVPKLWTPFAAEVPTDVEFCGAFVARSGAWTPPWLDSEFERFLARLTSGEVMSVPEEADYELPRPWSDEVVAKHVESLHEMMVRLADAG